MNVKEANKNFPNHNWILAELPDGYIDSVTECENVEGMYITAEGGEAYEEGELKFLDDNYLKLKLETLINNFSKDKIVKFLNEL